MLQIFPTTSAWSYFCDHLSDIRNVIDEFLYVPQWQSMAGPFGNKTKYSIADFDTAVTAQDTNKLFAIMNDAWGRAPESREVYYIPGFTEMCNLLDGTIEGFIDDGSQYEEDNE